jgi:hypothetical protein
VLDLPCRAARAATRCAAQSSLGESLRKRLEDKSGTRRRDLELEAELDRLLRNPR